MAHRNNIKLTYFDIKGRAEPARLILVQAGVNFEDCRINGDQWKELKPKTPCGQLPLLNYHGVEMSQSMTICRFLANEFNLAGKDACEQAQADMIVDLVNDHVNEIVSCIFEKDEKVKAEKMKKLKAEILPKCLQTLEKLLCQNGGKVFAGCQLTWADIIVANFLTGFVCGQNVALTCVPKLCEHIKMVMNLPNIKKWNEKYPMEKNIKLTYFNVRGRAEPSRLILALAGAKYEDERIEKEAWSELKSKTPCGELPILTYNGKVMAQSMSIARFLAKEFNLAGKNACEQGKADMIVDCVEDLRSAIVKVMKEQDDKRKAALMEKNKTETLPNGLKLLEKILTENGGKCFVGADWTWADLVVADFVHGIKDFGCSMADCPKLKGLVESVMSQPNIKKWVETRPKTAM